MSSERTLAAVTRKYFYWAQALLMLLSATSRVPAYFCAAPLGSRCEMV